MWNASKCHPDDRERKKKKNKSNANMESPITILWNVSKPRPDDREALGAGSAHTKPENGHRCVFANTRTNKNKYNHRQFQIQKYN